MSETTGSPEEALLPDFAAPAPTVTEATTVNPALETVYDVPVKVAAVLGKTRMNVAALMKLGEGAIIELDRKVGEPIDLYVNDRLIARGELVMVDGSLGVTMTEIVKEDEF
jgi:flagellar motor switch protein FliN/FliY